MPTKTATKSSKTPSKSFKTPKNSQPISKTALTSSAKFLKEIDISIAQIQRDGNTLSDGDLKLKILDIIFDLCSQDIALDFTVEDIQYTLETRGIYGASRLIGGVLQRVKRYGWCAAVDEEKSIRPKSKGRKITVWESCIR